MTKVLIIFLSLFCNEAISAVSNSSRKKIDNNLSEIKNKLYLNRTQLKEIQSKISTVDKRIASANERYLSTLKRKKKTDELILKVQLQVDELTRSINGVKRELKTIIELSLLNSMNNDQDIDQLALQRNLLNFLEKKTTELSILEKTLRANQKNLKEYSQRYEEQNNVENALKNSILNLETTKSSLAKNYMKVDGNYKVLRRKSKSLASRKRKALGSGIHRVPVDDFYDYEFKNKGVTFFFQDRKPVKASVKGVVNYVGEIGNYGNVVMIDHGNDLRTVYLGDFAPKLSKGQQVSRDSIIGYTKKGKEGRIYFEVRKKNKAQKTISLIDKRYFNKKK